MWRWVWFLAWAAGVSVPLTCLTALHSAPLPQAAERSLGDTKATAGRWQLTHVLAADCPCSKVVAEHLERRGPLPEVDERVWIVTDQIAAGDVAAPLTARGFSVRTIDAQTLASQFGVEGGPWLMVADPAGNGRYSGGYAPQRVSLPDEAQDVAILTRLKAGESVATNPAFGCATARSLRRQIDPLGLKYR